MERIKPFSLHPDSPASAHRCTWEHEGAETMRESSGEPRAALQVGGKDLKQMQQLGVWEDWEV